MAVLGAMPFAVQPFFLSVMSEALMLAPDQVGLLASADILGVVLASFSGFWWTRRFSHQVLVKLASMSMVLGYLGLLFADTFEAVLSLRFLAGVLGHGIAFSLGTALLCRAPHPDRAIAISVVTQISFSSLLLLALPKVLLATDIETVYWSLVAIVLVLLPLLKLTNNSIRYASESRQESHYQTADDVATCRAGVLPARAFRYLGIYRVYRSRAANIARANGTDAGGDSAGQYAWIDLCQPA